MLLRYKKASLKFIALVSEKEYPQHLIQLALKKENLMNLYKLDFDYNRYFDKVIRSTITSRNWIFKSQDDLSLIITDALIKSLSSEMVKKYIQCKDKENNLEKYLGRVLQNVLNNEISKCIRHTQNELKIIQESFHELEEHSYTDNYNELDYEELVKNVCEYIEKKGSRKVIVDIFKLTIEGLTLPEIARKLNFSYVYIFKMFHWVEDCLVEYAKETRNDKLLQLVKKYKDVKTSSTDEYFSNFYNMFNSLKSAKKISKLLKIVTLKDKLNQEYIREKILTPVKSSNEIYKETINYLSNFDDDSDIIQISENDVLTITAI